MVLDPVLLAQDLIRRPSVTPADEGALGVLRAAVEPLGFVCHPLRFEEAGTDPIDNLYARWGNGGRHFCFAGHTDVVPVGKIEGWSVDPFGAEIIEGYLYGRGAVDMKSAIAAFAAAAADFLADNPGLDGSISLLITGDEEAVAINGTKKMLDWLKAKGERLDHCVVGEPTNPRAMGEMMKIGRRGSQTGYLSVDGVQGHVAYPHLADNPVPKLVKLLMALGNGAIDDGTPHFQPSNLEVTTVDVGNPANNVIPARAEAVFNTRFNDIWTGESLEADIRRKLDSVGVEYQLKCVTSGEAFLTPPGELSALVAQAVEAETGRKPDLSTTGGTSDARFIRYACPVVEFGLVGQTMHKVDERVAVADLLSLTKIYRRILDGYFGA
ncbi:succinyl-diaminopimelate desuccinylase [Lacibacterium aquatile]|uniref:Succinyl-diaminopimelate desuccinylase n=1 Tax=Lacibacterium aquatile TaxID=1168082 RepID=A0ABW5DSN9_9PROT